jgi:Zn-finger nucleic acid-binding protein
VGLSTVLAQLSREDALAFACAARSRAVCAGRARCPRCLARSTQIQLGASETALRVDACAKCALVWLDRGAWAQLSRHDQLLLTKQESRRMAARWRLEVSQLGVQRDDETQPPDTLPEG